MRLFLYAVLMLFLASSAKAWQGDSINGKLVLRQHWVMKAGPIVRGGIGGQGAVLFAAKSRLHFQINAGATSTLIADSAYAKRNYSMLNGELRFHFPNSYTFRGKFAGLYYSYAQGEHTYKDVDLIGSTLIKKINRYRSQAHMIGIVIGGSSVGRRHDRVYVEGFAAAGYALKVTVDSSDTRYFPDQFTPVARRDSFELKFGLMLGLVGL